MTDLSQARLFLTFFVAAFWAALSPAEAALLPVGDEFRVPYNETSAAEISRSRQKCVLSSGITITLQLSPWQESRSVEPIASADQPNARFTRVTINTTTSTSSTSTSTLDAPVIPMAEPPDPTERHRHAAISAYVRGASGELLEGPIAINSESAGGSVETYLDLACSDDGRFAVVWIDSDTGGWRTRLFSTIGVPFGAEIHFSGSRSYSRTEAVSVALGDGGTVVVARAESDDEEVRVSVFDGAAGVPLSERLSTGVWDDVIVETLSLVRASRNRFVVVWAISNNDYGLYGAVLETQPIQLLAPFPIATFPGRRESTPSDVLLRGNDLGGVRVSWSTSDQGGRVARHIIEVEADEVDGTVPPTDFGGSFPWEGEGLPFHLGAMPSGFRYRSFRGEDFAGAAFGAELLVSWRDSEDSYHQEPVVHSTTGGSVWNVRYREPIDNIGAAVFATSGGKVWARLGYEKTYPSETTHAIIERSDTDGQTWSSPISLGAAVEKACEDLHRSRASLAADGNGGWIAVWEERRCSSRDDPQYGQTLLRSAVSRDEALTWHLIEQPLATIETAFQGGQVLMHESGATMFVWADETGVQLVRSGDSGQTWTTPQALFPVSEAQAAGVDQLSAAWAGSVAMIVWRGRVAVGADPDVFYSRSVDGGFRWSEPRLAAPFMSVDQAEDAEPSIGTDGFGLWTIAWRTHHSFEGQLGMDGDIVSISSSDDGGSWSEPVPTSLAASGDRDRDSSPTVFATGASMVGVGWGVQLAAEDGRFPESAYVFARIRHSCGDAQTDLGEECDDGNSIEGDGCDSNCTVSACGNRILDPSEECEDPRADENGSCPSGCRVAYCGDGFTLPGEEQCDDGNDSNTDACTNDCRSAGCFDGFVWEGEEACDDANGNLFDGCLECQAARCGDSVVWKDVEDCDDGNSVDDDWCRNDCTFGPECQLPFRSAPTASGALEVLRYVVGLNSPCSLQRCDADGSGTITLVDAQWILHLSVGSRSIQCPSRTRTFTLRLLSPIELKALQVHVSYGGLPMEFIQLESSRVDCTAPESTHFPAFNDRVRIDRFAFAMITADSFAGPYDLVTCRFNEYAPIEASDFGIEVVDANTGDRERPDLNSIAVEVVLD